MAMELPIYFYQDEPNKTLREIPHVPKNTPPSMLEYFKEALDPIQLKYEAGISLSQEGRRIAAEYQSTHYQYSSITKQEYSGILDNLRLVYGQEELVKNDIILFHTVETKLLCGYFGLPQLNQMFDEDYFNFEWDMHVGQNYSEHRSDYYRDHFIHQIRDLYMVYRLLEDSGFYEASKHILHDPSASKVSEYVYKKSQVFCRDRMGTQQQHLKEVFQTCSSEAPVGDEGGASGSPEDRGIKEEKLFNDYIERFYFKYVIYASSMMAALFHDMGYPICHFLGVRSRISAYNPTMYMFTHNAVESFDQLASKLGSSLLFSVVSPQVVRKRLEAGKEGRYDHGAYSAIAFLLKFYDSGVIYSLSAEKQCAIELAALAIFNHTSKFKALKPKADTSYYNMYFQQNPVSFLLRFCDDLQEWDRRYFEISKAGDLLFCPQCGYPFMKQEQYDENGHRLHKSKYCCRCRTEGGGLFRPDVFIKRKLYLVSVADWVEVSLLEVEKQPALVAKINYDPYKLLMLAKTNPTYAKYRARELKELKRLLVDQDFSLMTQKALPFSRIYLDYFMTPNPILIKLKILEAFLRRPEIWGKKCEKISTEDLITYLSKNRPPLGQVRLFSKALRFVFPSSKGKVPLFTFLKGTTETESALAFYFYLLRDCLRSIEGKEEPIPSTDVDKYLIPFKLQDPQYYETMSTLIRDCLVQYKKKMGDTSAYIADDEEEGFYQCVECYTDGHNYFNHFDAKPVKSFPYIGYFNDIFFFYCLYEQFWK